MIARAWVLAAGLALVGCGGGTETVGGVEHPVALDESDVTIPKDALAGVARCKELLAALVDPIKLGRDLHTHRPVADELAIVAGKMGELAAAGYPPEVAEKIAARGREISEHATNLAKYLRAGDAEKAATVHTTLQRLSDRLKGDLPRGGTPKDE